MAQQSSACFRPWPADSIERKPDGTIFVQWSEAELTDEALQEFLEQRLQSLLDQLPAGAPVAECVVDFSGNVLEKPGPIAQLLAKLREAPIHTTILRLHKNRLTDVCAVALADHIRKAAAAGRPLMQLHLSGNALGAEGVKQLIQAAHHSKGYPRPADAPRLRSLGGDSGRRALWLRVEQQKPLVEDPAGVLERLEAAGFPVCIVAREEPVPPTAVVQMHFAFLHPGGYDGDGKGKGKSKGKGKTGDSHPGAVYAPSQGQSGKATSKGSSTFQEASGKGHSKGLRAEYDFGGSSQGKGKAQNTGVEAKGRGFSGKGFQGEGKPTSKGGKDSGKGQQTQARYKVELCRFFAQGACDKGAQCSFAHGLLELRTQSEEQHSGRYKMDLCKYFAQGICDMGADCTFAHGIHELRTTRAPQETRSSPQPPSEGATSRFKTEICRFFEQGACKKGASCEFAHGAAELRTAAGDQAAPSGTRTGLGLGIGSSAKPQKKADDHQDNMEWLTMNRDRPGNEAIEFEGAWKLWCRQHRVHEMDKAQRLESIAAFRRTWEGEPTSSPAAAAAAVKKEQVQTEQPQGASGRSFLPPQESQASASASSAARSAPSSSAAAAAAETNEQAMHRLIGVNKLGKSKVPRPTDDTAPHRGCSWEAGPPAP